MRILVFSDTHGIIEPCIRAIHKSGKVDLILHAGDTSTDAEDLSYIFPEIPIRYVPGNCEISRLNTVDLIDIDDKKIFLTHGHLFNVKNEPSYTTLINKAKDEKATICIFGHTHKPILDNIGTFMLLNPGSVKFGNTYGVIEIENGVAKACILDI